MNTRIRDGLVSSLIRESGREGKTVRFPRGTLSLLELKLYGVSPVPFSRRSLPVFPSLPSIYLMNGTQFGHLPKQFGQEMHDIRHSHAQFGQEAILYIGHSFSIRTRDALHKTFTQSIQTKVTFIRTPTLQCQ